MRAGGGKEKGSEYERWTGKTLSLWVSEGQRADLFARNVLSGGSFTNAMKNGATTEFGTPGDLMANHPMAFAFLSSFFVECKHYADLGFEAFLFDHEASSFLGKVLAQCRKQAVQSNVWPLLVAKQNRRPSILLCDRAVGDAALAAVPGRLPALRHHHLHSGRTTMFLMEAFTSHVPPGRFIAAVAAIKGSKS